ncbi:MAG: hypothetical protein ACI9N1_002118 [Flavobacteriales bacterium]|jgi:hypothetical protein
MDILQGIGLLALAAVAYFIYENYSKSQLINPEEESLFRLHSDAYSDLSDDFRSGRIDRGNFERRKREILNNPGEKRKVALSFERQNEDELERKEELKKMRIVGYKYDEFIFKIFNDNHELTWSELEDGVQKTFNLEILDLEAIREYHEDDLATPSEEMLYIWLDNKLIEICDWSKWSEKNPWNIEHFKVGNTLRYKHLQINDYDITYDVWLEDQNITLKHNKYYDVLMAENSNN